MYDTDRSESPRLAKVGEVANYLSLSRSKIYLMMEQGTLPYVKFGKSRRVRWADVEILIGANTVSRS